VTVKPPGDAVAKLSPAPEVVLVQVAAVDAVAAYATAMPHPADGTVIAALSVVPGGSACPPYEVSVPVAETVFD
jgi:hypothetical protein